MANQEHLDVLKQGVEVWNQWRRDNPEIRPDLSGANLSNAKLNGAYLSRTYLSGADLKTVDLSDANLSQAYLSEANLIMAKLIGTNLSQAILIGANLSQATLIGANLSAAYLRQADFRGADLTGADLRMASLHVARLINTKLDRANLSESCLWETQRARWSIRGIICESVYWDEKAENKITYQLGDFERLFADKTIIRLFYADGITPVEIATLPALIKHLEDANPGCGLRLVSIREDSGGAVVELVIEDFDEHSTEQMKQLQSALEAEAQQKIEYLRQALIEERETRLQLEGSLAESRTLVDKLILRPNIIVKGEYMGDTYNIAGQAGAVGPNAHAHDMTFNQLVNHVEQTIDLAELAKQLSDLRQAIVQRQDASPQAAIAIGEVAKAEIAATEKNPSKVVEHLKAAGNWTLDFAKNIGKDLVVDLIKKATGMP